MKITTLDSEITITRIKTIRRKWYQVWKPVHQKVKVTEVLFPNGSACYDLEGRTIKQAYKELQKNSRIESIEMFMSKS